MKEKANPNYHEGKRTGYNLINGEYHIAPCYIEQFARLSTREEGLRKVIEIMTAHFAQDMTDIARIRRKIWAELEDDLGLDKKVNYNYSNGIVRRADAEPNEANKEVEL